MKKIIILCLISLSVLAAELTVQCGACSSEDDYLNRGLFHLFNPTPYPDNWVKMVIGHDLVDNTIIIQRGSVKYFLELSTHFKHFDGVSYPIPDMYKTKVEFTRITSPQKKLRNEVIHDSVLSLWANVKQPLPGPIRPTDSQLNILGGENSQPLFDLWGQWVYIGPFVDYYQERDECPRCD